MFWLMRSIRVVAVVIVVVGMRCVGLWGIRPIGIRVPLGIGVLVVGAVAVGVVGVGIARARRPIHVLHIRVVVVGTISVHVSSASRDDAVALENTGTGSGGDRRASVIGRCEHAVIVASHLLVLRLQRSGLNVTFVHCGALRPGRLCCGATNAAVIADVVDDGVVHVRVVNDGGVYVGDGGVVAEHPTTPYAADEADTTVAEAVVNAAIEADVRAPITGVPSIGAPYEAPIAGSPKEAGCGSKHPSAGNPKVAVWAIGPITGSPDITGSRADRLRINRKRGRPDVNGDTHGDLRRGGRGHSQSGKGHKQKQCS